jgi:hypothetical protein
MVRRSELVMPTDMTPDAFITAVAKVAGSGSNARIATRSL